jgi:fused signal recognition particle receptor
MTFDWFRRQHDNDTPKADEAATPEPAAAEPESTPAVEPSPQQDEMLNWAKLAYENLRKRQQEAAAQTEAPLAIEAPTAPISEAETNALTEAEAIPENAANAIAETAQEAIPEVAPATLPEPEPIAQTVVEAETADEAAETADLSPEVASAGLVDVAPDLAAASTEEPAPVAVPFWAAAEAERQARLEQLRETAIVEPEPAPAVVADGAVAALTATAPVEADFAFDEGFLWSAEVLAAQGRRPDEISLEEITWLKRLRQGLDKTRRGLINQLKAIVGQGPLNQDAVMEIEAALLQADVGVEATDAIIEALQQKLRDETLPPDAAIDYLKQIIRDMLEKPLGDTMSAAFAPQKDVLNIWLMTGVNGAGKTTTIGKLSHIAQKSGYQCLIAAADTFRAAAVEQVKVWGERSGVEVIANPGKNTDPAAVVFDAITAAQARGADLLLVDTAGRLQNKKNLMDELSKVRRIIDKKAPDAVVESLLVLDSTLGQNGLRQAEVFAEAAKLSGVVLTKLDGTAKGGIALAVVKQLDLPIRFIGAGEGIEDLRPFSSYEFVEALLNG